MPSLIQQAIDLFAAARLEVVSREFDDIQQREGARRGGDQPSQAGEVIRFSFEAGLFMGERRTGGVLMLWWFLPNAQQRGLPCLPNR
jgi:hypothetical protein